MEVVELAMMPVDWFHICVSLYLCIYLVYLYICILIFVVNHLYVYSVAGCSMVPADWSQAAAQGQVTLPTLLATITPICTYVSISVFV